jgi:predicted secreted protein
MSDKRSKKIVVVSHCMLNVHSLEDNLAEYRGMEEEVVTKLMAKGVGIYQIPCPEIELSGIFRKALPKESYEHPKIRKIYAQLAAKTVNTLKWYVKKGYAIVAVIGAEGSPTCGIHQIGKWKEGIKPSAGQFPRDVEFIRGRGVFMEELEKSLHKAKIFCQWLGIPGKSIRSRHPHAFDRVLEKIDKEL